MPRAEVWPRIVTALIAPVLTGALATRFLRERELAQSSR